MADDLFERWHSQISVWARSKHRELASLQMEPLDLAHSFISDKYFQLLRVHEVGYVRKMFKNYLIDCIRKAKWQRYVEPIDETTEYRRAHSGPSIEADCLSSSRELSRWLSAADLTKTEQELINLCLAHATDYTMIARAMGKSEGAVRTAVSRLRQKIADAELDGNVRIPFGDLAGRLWTAYMKRMERGGCTDLDQELLAMQVLENYPDSRVRTYFAEKSRALSPKVRLNLYTFLALSEEDIARRAQALVQLMEAVNSMPRSSDGRRPFILLVIPRYPEPENSVLSERKAKLNRSFG